MLRWYIYILHWERDRFCRYSEFHALCAIIRQQRLIEDTLKQQTSCKNKRQKRQKRNGKNGLVLSVTYTPCVHASSALLGNGLSKCLIYIYYIVFPNNPPNVLATQHRCTSLAITHKYYRALEGNEQFAVITSWPCTPSKCLQNLSVNGHGKLSLKWDAQILFFFLGGGGDHTSSVTKITPEA